MQSSFFYRTDKSVFQALINCRIKRTLETSGQEIRSGNDIDFQVDQSSLVFEVVSEAMFLEECKLIEKGLISNHWLWLVDGELVKVGLVPGSFLIFDQTEDLHRISFKFKRVAEQHPIVSVDLTEAGPLYTYLEDPLHGMDDGTFKLGF